MASRAERAAEVARLRAAGLVFREIADLMGISKTYAASLSKDPTGEQDRQRKRSYGRPCRECGKTTDGSNGRDMAPMLCIDCTNWERHWESVKRIIDAMQRFAERHGRPPSAPDFSPADARNLGHAWRAERFYQDGDYPWSTEVTAVFGTWNAAVTAAGFEPCESGRYPRVSGRSRGGAHLEDERTANA